jgi:hypothetical protein
MARKRPPRQAKKVASGPKQFVSELSLGARYTVPRDQLIRNLFGKGWLVYDTEAEALKKAVDQELRTALLAYQHFHGLDTDGWAGPVTQRSLEEPRFCALADVMPLQQDLCRWRLDQSNPRILWTVQGRLPVLDAQQCRDAFAWAWAQWAAVCNVRPEYTDDPNQANVVVEFGDIDRAGGTLAWSELPCAQGTTRLGQRFDTAEAWVISATPKRFEIDLNRVACHEIGHVLGLPHLASGSLMQPIYDPNIRTPQVADVQEMVARYGKPKAGLPSPVPSPGRSRIVLEIDGSLVGGEFPGWKLVSVATG